MSAWSRNSSIYLDLELVAENQVQIMQDLQKTNIDFSIENQKNLEKITQLSKNLKSLKDLGETQS